MKKNKVKSVFCANCGKPIDGGAKFCTYCTEPPYQENRQKPRLITPKKCRK